MENEKEVKEELKEEPKEELKKEIPKRQIIIETDGNSVSIIKAEVAGNLELRAVLESILRNMQ